MVTESLCKERGCMSEAEHARGGRVRQMEEIRVFMASRRETSAVPV